MGAFEVPVAPKVLNIIEITVGDKKKLPAGRLPLNLFVEPCSPVIRVLHRRATV